MNRTFLLAIGPAAFAGADAAITLIGQPETYWSGDYAAAHEFNPIAAVFLRLHPLWFVVGVGVWISGFVTLIHYAPPKWSRYLSLAILFGHAFGLSTWLLQYPYGIALMIGAMCLMRVAAIPACDKPAWLSEGESKS